MCKTLLTVVAAFFSVVAHSVAADQSPEVEVTVRKDRESYVLGQPVVLDVAVANKGTMPLAVVQLYPGEFDEFPIHLAREGRATETITLGLAPTFLSRGRETLNAGASRTYRIRMLYRHGSSGPLAVTEPGTYEVRLDVPLRVVGAQRAMQLRSQALSIRFEKPAGGDADAFSTIQDRPFVMFMQFGRAAEKGDGVIKRAVELLEKFPTSSYRDAVRLSLRSDYRFSRSGLAADFAARLKKAAGIHDPFDFDDKRLDKKVDRDWQGPVSLERVLDSLSKQSGVRLESAPVLKAVELKLFWSAADLREKMYDLDQRVRAYWFPKGDGYILAPPDYEPTAGK